MLTLEELGNPATAQEIEIAAPFWESLESEIEFTKAYHFGLPPSELVRNEIGEKWEFFEGWRDKNRARIQLSAERMASRLPADAKILEVGCGSGQVAFALEQLGFEVHGIDLSVRAIEIGQKILEEQGSRVSIREGNALDLPFEDGQFRAVVSWDVVEHIPDQKRFLSEIHRVLAPNGVAYLHTDNDVRVQLGVWARRLTCWLRGHNPFRWRHAYAGLEGGHCALVTPKTLSTIAESVGFDQTRMRYEGSMLPGTGYLTAPKFSFEAHKPATSEA